MLMIKDWSAFMFTLLRVVLQEGLMETPKNILASYRLKKGQIKMGFGSHCLLKRPRNTFTINYKKRSLPHVVKN